MALHILAIVGYNMLSQYDLSLGIKVTGLDQVHPVSLV